MSEQPKSHDYVRLLFSLTLIFVGSLILAGIISLPAFNNPWLPWLLAITGVFLASIPAPFTRQAGIAVLAVGIYLILSYANIVSLPILQYGFGAVLILVGIVSLTRHAEEGSTTLNSPQPPPYPKPDNSNNQGENNEPH